MLIRFKRSRLRALLDSIHAGRCIPCARNDGEPWSNNDLLALAGTCMAELMVRRELKQIETTEEPLRCHLKQPFGRVSPRMAVALDYVVSIASTITNDCTAEGDKTYKMEVVYNGPEFELLKPPKAKPKPDDGPPAPDGSPPQGESPASGNAVMQTAA